MVARTSPSALRCCGRSRRGTWGLAAGGSVEGVASPWPGAPAACAAKSSSSCPAASSEIASERACGRARSSVGARGAWVCSPGTRALAGCTTAQVSERSAPGCMHSWSAGYAVVRRRSERRRRTTAGAVSSAAGCGDAPAALPGAPLGLPLSALATPPSLRAAAGGADAAAAAGSGGALRRSCNEMLSLLAVPSGGGGAPSRRPDTCAGARLANGVAWGMLSALMSNAAGARGRAASARSPSGACRGEAWTCAAATSSGGAALSSGRLTTSSKGGMVSVLPAAWRGLPWPGRTMSVPSLRQVSVRLEEGSW